MECENYVQRALEISSQLVKLANADRDECSHDGCRLLDAIVLDCGMKIRQEALERTSELHVNHDLCMQ